MTRFFLLLFFLVATHPALAEKIKYYQDPVFEKIADGDVHPMGDMIDLAEKGDVRAQFILGDLYAKGKGGFTKNLKKGAFWFEKSAAQGYDAAFIRLAALAKSRSAPVDAYQWYSLALEHGQGKTREYARKAREDLKLSPEDIGKARKATAAWKKDRIKEMREKAEEEKLEKRRAAIAKKNTQPKKETEHEQD